MGELVYSMAIPDVYFCFAESAANLASVKAHNRAKLGPFAVDSVYGMPRSGVEGRFLTADLLASKCLVVSVCMTKHNFEVMYPRAGLPLSVRCFRSPIS